MACKRRSMSTMMLWLVAVLLLTSAASPIEIVDHTSDQDLVTGSFDDITTPTAPATSGTVRFCRGRPASDGVSCTGKCKTYNIGSDGFNHGIRASGTNCLDSEPNWNFWVCSRSLECHNETIFHPWRNANGRWIYNIPHTHYIFDLANFVNDCKSNSRCWR